MYEKTSLKYKRIMQITFTKMGLFHALGALGMKIYLGLIFQLHLPILYVS